MASARHLPFCVAGLIAAIIPATSFLVVRAPAQDAAPVAHAAPKRAGDGIRLRYPAGRYPVLPLPDGRTQQVRSILDIDHAMRFGDYVWNEDGVGEGPVTVRIDLARQMLSVFRGGHEIGTAVILYGTDGKPTPTGLFPVLARAESHKSTLYDATMPYMLRLTGDGVAIHASNVRKGFATHGCIGVPLEFARRLYGVVGVGDEVAILPAGSART